MISSNYLCANEKPLQHLIKRAQNEQILCYQLSANDPTIAASAAQRVEHYGADLVDLNCGCPKRKIRKKGVGSALLEQPKLLASIIKNIRLNTHLPLTVKIRVSGNSSTPFHVEIAKLIEDCGADALIVHGRHWTDGYDAPIQSQQIREIVESISIPVIANGDIDSYASFIRLLQQTGAAGAMISRAGTGRPWLYQEILCQASGSSFQRPSLKERFDLFTRHILDLASIHGEHTSVLHSRSLVKYYFRQQMSQEKLLSLYAIQHLDSFFGQVKIILQL